MSFEVPIRENESRDGLREPDRFIQTSSGDEEAVRFLNELFCYVIQEQFSDIHFEEMENGCEIRVRYSGRMHKLAEVNKEMANHINTKIRMKCKLSIVDRMKPLDGKFRFRGNDRYVDVRVSILPLASGQSIVCRILDQRGEFQNLDQLDIPSDIRDNIRQIVRQPQGLFLVTGPTGSGKTTTLYAVLQELNSPEVKIITVEDPVEYRLPGTCQVQTNNQLSFADALRSILRQDPDVILVGEIRDMETARLAVQASLTGHIVFSTLHTNNALITLNRMLDLGVDPTVFASALSGMSAQRLAKRLCPHCAIGRPLQKHEREQMIAFGLDASYIDRVERVFDPNPKGCQACVGRGWIGRTPVIELIVATPEVRLAVEKGSYRELEQAALKQSQYRTLAQDVMRLVLEGTISFNEAISVVGSTLAILET